METERQREREIKKRDADKVRGRDGETDEAVDTPREVSEGDTDGESETES